MAKRPLRKTNRTVLIVVEGETEEAFVVHLRSLYYQRGMLLSLRIRNAYGYGPQGVIDRLRSSVAQGENFAHRIAVLDGDIPLKATEKKWLQQAKIQTIISFPAIEATLLAILGMHAPDTTDTCKNELQKRAPGDQTEAYYYKKNFPFETLEKARGKVPALEALIAAVSTE